VDEWNRVRIQLGLKPLNDGAGGGESSKSGDAEAVENMRVEREKQALEAHNASVKAAIAKAKNKRELHAKVAGKSLGEASDVDSMAEWLNKHKKKEKEMKKKAMLEKRKRALMEDDDDDDDESGNGYSSKNLAGLKVDHKLDAFHAGESVIMTLKDSDVLGEVAYSFVYPPLSVPTVEHLPPRFVFVSFNFPFRTAMTLT
jgi:U4/U6.U5 tri-snRNP-associated protein 1